MYTLLFIVRSVNDDSVNLVYYYHQRVGLLSSLFENYCFEDLLEYPFSTRKEKFEEFRDLYAAEGFSVSESRETINKKKI